MARQLLAPATVAGVSGPWVRIEGGGKRSVPARVQATGNFAIGASAVGPITIQELVGGLPGSGSQSPYSPQVTTGDIVTIATISGAGDDILLNNPVAYIRAVTAADMSGTVDYCGVEMLE
jgi:hypothetical protein